MSMSKSQRGDYIEKKLLQVLENEGTDAFLSLAVDLIKAETPGVKGLSGQIAGDVCETVLIGLTRQYLKLTGKPGQIFHSVVLKDLSEPKSEYVTELDTVLISPYFIVTSECKSYRDGIKITAPCTIHGHHKVDVYKQSKLHYKILMGYARQLALPNLHRPNLPVFANGFVFSDGPIKDLRENKSSFQVLTTSTLVDYLEYKYSKLTVPTFDYKRACKVFKVCQDSDVLHDRHANNLGYRR